MVPSNFQLVVESRGREHFNAAMKMCFDDHSSASHYRIDKDGLHLFWGTSSYSNTKEDGVMPLPYEMTVSAATEFAWGWLQTADRGSEPDHDGSNSKDGFRVEHKSGRWSYEFVRVSARWSEYHK